MKDGNLRTAFYLAYDEEGVKYYSLAEIKEAIERGEQCVATTFVIPYPPGFPVAVPGQVRKTREGGEQEEEEEGLVIGAKTGRKKLKETENR